MKKIILFGLLCLTLITNNNYAQSRCGSQIRHQQLLETDVVYAQQWQKFVLQSDNWMKNAKARTDGSSCAGGTITIPVVFHFEYNALESEKACIIALANSQIDHLNQAYSGTSCSDPSGTQSSSGGCVKFVIANKNHPASSGLQDGQPAILFGSDPCPNINNIPGPETSEEEDYQTCAVQEWAGYLNLVIKFKIQNGTLGISSFPPESSIALSGQGAQNSVIISSCTFGLPGGAAPCSVEFTGGTNCVSDFEVNQGGTTATHEIGHFFGLPHTFCRDASGNPSNTDSDGSLSDGEGCQNDEVCMDGCQTTACDCDGIADTPPQAYAQFGCPGGSANGTAINPSTPGTDYTYNNFMDYVDDNCMQCFSSQQATRIQNRSRDAANAPKEDVYSDGSGGDSGGGDEKCTDGSDKKTPGTTCDDGDADTTNGQIQADGCTCKGTVVNVAECNTPDTPEIVTTNSKSVKIDWNDVSGANSYTLQVRFKGMERWLVTVTFKHSRVSVSGPARDYEFRLKSNCGGSSSAYSQIFTFTILDKNQIRTTNSSSEARSNEPEAEIVIPNFTLTENYLEVSPNPAREELQIKFQFTEVTVQEITQIKVIDLIGRTIITRTIDANQLIHRLDISELSNGLYHLVVEQGTKQPLVKKFVKKE